MISGVIDLKNIVPGICDKMGIDVCYLFGSRADGTEYSDSDIDLGVAFRDYHPDKYDLAKEIMIQQIFEESLNPYSVDLIFIQRAPINLKYSIINGKVIFSADEGFRTDMEEVVVRDYLDFKPVLDAYYREMAETILSGE